MKTVLLTTMFLFAGWRASVVCAGFAYEPFDYPSDRAGQQLVQQSGGTGFASGWTALYGYSNNYWPTAGSLSSSGLAVSGNSVASPSTNGIYALARTTLQSFMGDGLGTHFLSFLIRRDSTGGNYGGFGGLYVDGTVNDLFIGKGGNYDNWGIEIRGGTAGVASDVPATVDQTALLVLKMESRSGLDLFTLYVNPTAGLSEPNTSPVTFNLDVGTADKIVLYNSGAYTFDEIRIGDSFADVTPTPEPSTLLLGALGISPLLASRVRRRFSTKAKR